MRSTPVVCFVACWFLLGAACVGTVDAKQVGLWQFDGNLNNGLAGGTAMTAQGDWSPSFVTETINGSPANVLSFPAFDFTQALNMPNQAGPSGNGVETRNNWSIVMDVKLPVDGSSFISLWETDALGAGDGDYFINTSGGIGIAGQYNGFVNADTWTRIAVTVDTVSAPGQYTLNGYLDGIYAGTAITGAAPGGKEAVKSFLHLFADDDAETAAGLVNSVAYYGEVLSESAIGTLGGSAAAGVPASANQAGLWNFSNNLNNAVSGGAPMAAAGGWAPAYVNETIGGSPATVLSFPAMTDSQALDMPNQAPADDPGIPTATNVWSIVMDVKFPLLNSFTSLWDTDSIIEPDGEYFIRDDSGAGTAGGIGIAEQYSGVVEADKWTRIAVTVDDSGNEGQYLLTGYIDGVEVGTSLSSTVPDGRQGIDAVLHLFGDNDFETAAGLVNSVAFYDEVLTAAEIQALGAASAAGIAAEVGVPGDYNENGVVDVADYTEWRDNFGAAISLPNEGATPGSVTQQDYDFWKANFGNDGAGSGAVGGAAVPEPAGCCLAWMALCWGVNLGCRSRARLASVC